MDKSPIDTQPERVAAAAKNMASALTTAKTTPEITDESEFVSKGNKWHNRITYRGVDWLLNTAIAVAAGYAARNTKLGKSISEPVDKWTEEKILIKWFKVTEKVAKESAEWGTNLLSIMVGGTATIPIMMGLENKKNKKKIVKALDEKFYGKETVANDPKFEESYKKIDEEPKKGFWVGMATRLVALTPFIAAIMYKPVNSRLSRYMYEPVAKVTRTVAETVGIRPKKMMNTSDMLHPHGDRALAKETKSKWKQLHSVIGLDLSLTFFYSFVHEWAYKAVAAVVSPFKKKDENTTPAKPETIDAAGEAKTDLATDTTSKPDKKWADTVEKQENSATQSVSFQESLNKDSGTEAHISA